MTNLLRFRPSLRSASGPALVVLANALAVLGPQLAALALLDSADYGAYSFVYLTYAFGASVVLSFVSDSSTRAKMLRGIEAPWSEYSATLLQISILIGLMAAAASAVVTNDPSAAPASGLAVGLATYRVGERYREVHGGNYRAAVGGDILIFASLATMWTIAELSGLETTPFLAYSIWAVCLLASSVRSRRPKVGTLRTLRIWYLTRRWEVQTLLGESLLMDLGAILVPALMLPILHVGQFGPYRAVTTVAAPVRILLNPMRPVLARLGAARLTSFRAVLGVAAISISTGGFSVCLLLLLGQMGLESTALGEISEYSPQVGIYVATNFFGHYWYLVARAVATQASIMTSRIVQTLLVSAGPLLGGLLFGLEGALWALVIATLISSMTWMSSVLHGSR